MFDFGTQYSIDENITTQQDIVLDEQNGSKEHIHQKISRNSDEAFLVEILREQGCEEEHSEGKFTEVPHGEDAKRLSGASDFHDMDCGEPATGQHLIIDFGMTDEDNREVEKKCSSFWKFVNSHPHLQDIKVFPIQRKSMEDSSPSNRTESTDEVNAMKWLENEDYLKTAMRPKLMKTYCSLSGGDYWERTAKTSKNVTKLKHKGNGERSNSISISPRDSFAEELKTISKCMDEWDAAHSVQMNAPILQNIRDGSV